MGLRMRGDDEIIMKEKGSRIKEERTEMKRLRQTEGVSERAIER